MIDTTSPQLIVRRGPKPDHVYILTEETSIVGREPINDVVLPDPEISRRHSRIVLRNGIFHIEDLSSTNGTYINGRRIASLTPLADGDVIDFGETIRVVFNWKSLPVDEETLSGSPMHIEPKPHTDSSISHLDEPLPPSIPRSSEEPSAFAPEPTIYEGDGAIDQPDGEAQWGDAETISELSGVSISPPSPIAPTARLVDRTSSPDEPVPLVPADTKGLFSDRRVWLGLGCAVLALGLCACMGGLYFLDTNYPDLLYGWLPA